MVADGADDHEPVAIECGGVKVGRREHVPRVAVNRNGAVRVEHDDIVVDVEIRVVGVLVFAGDADQTPVGQFGSRLSIRSNVQIGPSSRFSGT